MCRRVQCGKCKKPSYSGCGMHVEQVLGDVPREDRCKCREEAGASEGGESPWAAIRKLFGT